MLANRDPAASSAREEWRAHWPIPAVSLIAMMVVFAHVYTMGVFLAPVQHAFGWSRTAISAGLTIVSVISVIAAPFTGVLIDRYGPRRIALPGLLLYCAGFAALSLTTANIWSWWFTWLVVGIGSICTKPTVWAAAISRRFDRGRGAAMAVALCGSGLGGMVLPLLATVLVADHGWRTALLAIGLGGALLSVPMVFLFFRDAPVTSAVTRATASARAATLPGMPLREALTSSRFLRLAVATLLVTVALLAITVPLVPILTDRGLSVRAAAATAGLVGVSATAGRLATGFLLDRFAGPPIGAVAFSLPILACLLLQAGSAYPTAAALLLGLSVGAEVDVVMFMASRYFGLRHFGVLYGTLGGLTSLGTGLGPLLSGIVYDRAGSYHPLFLMLIPVFAIAALLVASLGRYPNPPFGSMAVGTEPQGVTA